MTQSPGDRPSRHMVVPAEAERLDRLLAGAWADLSRSRIQALIKAGHVAVEGAPCTDPSWKPPPGVGIVLHEPPPVAAAPQAEAIPLAVLFEDADLIVLDKPAGIVVHPGAGHTEGTLVNALIAHCGEGLSGIGGVARPGIVHRLDRDTSGVLVVAKTDRAHQGLSAQFADHGRSGVLERAYLALVWGLPAPPRGRIEASLARAAHHRERIAVVAADRGRHAVTHYEVECSYESAAGEPLVGRLRCRLETGRTHQIRVHLAHLGHPLLGDPLYGAGYRTKAARLGEEARRALEAMPGQALHAALLQFAHPVTGTPMRFETDPPPAFGQLEEALRGGAEVVPSATPMHRIVPGRVKRTPESSGLFSAKVRIPK